MSDVASRRRPETTASRCTAANEFGRQSTSTRHLKNCVPAAAILHDMRCIDLHIHGGVPARTHKKDITSSSPDHLKRPSVRGTAETAGMPRNCRREEDRKMHHNKDAG